MSLRCVLVLATVATASAWGRDGHEMIAKMASTFLTPSATKQVGLLLDGQAMSDVANWADSAWRWPAFSWSEPLHFTNVQDTSAACVTPTGYDRCTFVYARDCVNKNNEPDMCNAGAVHNFTRQLTAARGKVTNSSSDALRFLIHFLGDIHQPLHVAMAPDRGGVKMNVVFDVPGQGSDWNLHNVWDFGMIVRAEGTEGHQDALVASMLKQIKDGAFNATVWAAQTDPREWVQEGLDVATSTAYRFSNGTQLPPYDSHKRYGPINIPDAYCKSYMATGGAVEVQLAKAGVRLATLLNAILDPA